MADNFYSKYSVESSGGGGGSGVSSLNALTGALSLVAGSGITITPSGSNITIAATGGGSGANTALSNLVAPTSLNADLIFNEGAAATIQTLDDIALTQDLNLRTGNDSAGDGSNSGSVFIKSGDLSNGGYGNSGNLSLLTGSSLDNTGASTGNILIKTGDTGAGFSGNIQLVAGTSLGSNTGTVSFNGGNIVSIGSGSGTIKFQDSTQGTIGQVWTSVDVNGGGAWAANSGGGANVFLSNLTSPIAINQALTPGITNTFAIGSSSFIWSSMNVGLALDTSSGTSIDFDNRTLNSIGSNIVASWTTASHFVLSGGTSLDLTGATSGVFSQLAADTTTPYSVKWPAAQGGPTTFLSNDGSGNLSWSAGTNGAVQSATILFSTGQNFDGGGFANPFPFTTAAAVAGSTLALIGTNQFVAQNTGPHLFNFTATSTNFMGTEWGQIAYQVNSGGQIVFTLGNNANSLGAARVVPNGDGIVMLTAGDTLQFYSNTNGTTNWIAYQISLTDLTPR